jgi:hypothetical protein
VRRTREELSREFEDRACCCTGWDFMICGIIFVPCA